MTEASSRVKSAMITMDATRADDDRNFRRKFLALEHASRQRSDYQRSREGRVSRSESTLIAIIWLSAAESQKELSLRS